MTEHLFALRRFFAFLTLPYFRWELPGWERLSSYVGLPISNEGLWAGARPRTVRGKLHGLRMTVHMQDWCERLTYFLGRYYDLPVELLLQSLLGRGETFIDAGGNIGMVTLTGAAWVGSEGMVYAFEPNPAMVARMREMVLLNGLDNVRIYPIGLSDEQGELQLTTVAQAGGWGTFAKVMERSPALTYGSVTARVARLDDVIPASINGLVVIKIDVEGFECRVLHGAINLIERLHPAIVTEYERPLLLAAGTSPEEMFHLMRAQGYVGYFVSTSKGKWRRTLTLREISVPDNSSRNILWVYPDSQYQQRVMRYIVKS